jgi:predicted GTPase
MEPNYEKMYLSELKLIAKTRRIKMYYIKSKEELIELLNMNELPLEMRIEKMTNKQLQAEAKNRGITGVTGLRRPALINILFPKTEDVGKTASDENQENQSKADEHHQPEEHDPEEIRV